MYGKAFSFDGNDEVVLIEEFDQLDLRGDMTVHLWAKRSALGGERVMAVKGAGLIANIDVPTSFALKFGSEVSPGGTGDYLWGGFEQSNGSDVFLAGPEVTDSLFHHYAYVRAGSNHKLFLDGVAVASELFVGSPGSTSGIPLSIGNGPSRINPFDGIIDEVQIFDRALTDAEIVGMFAAANSDERYQISVAAKHKGVERFAVVEVVVKD